MADKKNPVQSVDRVLDILEALSNTPQGMSLSELAAATQLHISTAHRLVNSLAERGYTHKDQLTGKYRLTLRLFEISQRVCSLLGLLSVSEHRLEELACFAHEAVHLVERDGNQIVYLYKFEPFQHLINMNTYVGCRNPMYCTGVGKAILAMLPPKEVKGIWESTPIEAFTPQTITSLEEMQKELAVIRGQGYAFDNEEHERGVRCVAAPICNWKGEPIGAISVSAPVSRLTDGKAARILPKILEAADEISSLMGKAAFQS